MKGRLMILLTVNVFSENTNNTAHGLGAVLAPILVKKEEIETYDSV
jgi:hypothetical protein